uniref:Chitooligosaccharide deacetylase n=1 Tax=OCS116 cluster bacterium TaxID=2030921 RepID=A0A2A4Z931_9PROT
MRLFGASLLKNMLNFVYFSGLSTALKPVMQGDGIIFMLHHILPDAVQDESKFRPNGLLEVTPDFLEQVILYLQANDYEIISLDEMQSRLESGVAKPKKPYIIFTIDDGYLDNLEHAYPVFKKHNCPFTIYVATDLCDHKLFMWWRALDAVIRDNPSVEFDAFGIKINKPTGNVSEKYAAYNEIYWQLRDMGEVEKRQAVLALAKKYKFDPIEETKLVAMSWVQLKQLEQDELVTIGAHTISHSAIAKLSDADAKIEIEQSRAIIRDKTGIECAHFCYPYGSAAEANLREFKLTEQAGYKTAVTTQKGMLYAGHKAHLHALPRVSLNGDYQHIRYVKTYLSGLPFMLWNRFRKIHKY